MAALEQHGAAGEKRHAEHRSKLRFLLRSAASLASTTMVTAGLGFAFWAVAARAFPASEVGESPRRRSPPWGSARPTDHARFRHGAGHGAPSRDAGGGRTALVSTVTAGLRSNRRASWRWCARCCCPTGFSASRVSAATHRRGHRGLFVEVSSRPRPSATCSRPMPCWPRTAAEFNWVAISFNRSPNWSTRGVFALTLARFGSPGASSPAGFWPTRSRSRPL